MEESTSKHEDVLLASQDESLIVSQSCIPMSSEVGVICATIRRDTDCAPQHRPRFPPTELLFSNYSKFDFAEDEALRLRAGDGICCNKSWGVAQT